MDSPGVLNASLLRRCMFRIMAVVVAINTLNFVLKHGFDFHDDTRDATSLIFGFVLTLACVTAPILRVRDRTLTVAHLATTSLYVGSRFLACFPPTYMILHRSLDLLVVIGVTYTLFRCLVLMTQAERRLLERLAEGTSGRYSDHFLTSLSDTLVQTLDLTSAFVSKIVRQDDSEVVIARAESDGSNSVQTLSPPVGSTIDIATFGFEKTCGPTTVLPLTNHRDEKTGHLVLIHARAKELTEGQRTVLNAYASRAAAEVERKAADEEKQQLELKMLQGQKLEGLGLLAGGVAHDFNNLLAAMRNHAALARSMISDQSVVSENIRSIESAVDQGAAMCERLLAYAGQSPRENVVFDFSKIVLDTVSIVEAAHAGMPSAIIRLSDEPTWVWGDASQLSQVILNLLTNAVDASGVGSGYIEISTDVVECASDSRAEIRSCVLFKVVDYGKGITSEALPKIFDPFFSTKEKGRGLGLAAVAGVIKDHHGELNVESELGVGTCFSVTIPLTDRRPKDVTANGANCDGSPLLNSNNLVLVVDDNELVRISTKALLKCSGYNVLSVASGAEAIEAFEKYGSAIGVVLLDQTMPVMTGLDTYKALRKLGASADFIFMSGHSTLEFDDEVFEEVRFVRKPFSPEQLLTLLAASDAFANSTHEAEV